MSIKRFLTLQFFFFQCLYEISHSNCMMSCFSPDIRFLICNNTTNASDYLVYDFSYLSQSVSFWRFCIILVLLCPIFWDKFLAPLLFCQKLILAVNFLFWEKRGLIISVFNTLDVVHSDHLPLDPIPLDRIPLVLIIEVIPFRILLH